MDRAVPALLRTQAPEMRLHRIGGLLARWHLWRRRYSPERGYARPGGPTDPEDELEELLMGTVELHVARMSLELQRALSQVARAECLGVECQLDSGSTVHRRAVALLESGLIGEGLL